MAMQMYWATDIDTVLMWEFNDHWTWDEYHSHIKTLITMSSVAKVPRVDIIVDMTKSAGIPSGIISNILAGNPAEGSNTNGWGLTVVVGGGVLIQTMLNVMRTLSSVIREHYITANNIPEAKKLILRERS
jgi:hypothetical protein